MRLHRIQNMQKPRVPDNKFWLEFIGQLGERLKEKQCDEAFFHAQVCGCYGAMLMLEECKKHAALVPDWAHAQEKTHALVSVARLLIYEKKIEEALALYEQAYNIDPEHDTAIEEAGWCCYELKRWEKAEEWFTKGTLLEDAEWCVWESLGHALYKQEKKEAALVAYKKALELCAIEAYNYYYDYLIGQCYMELGDFYRALNHFTKSLDAKPAFAAALNALAALYFNEEGDTVTAIGYLKKAEAAAEKDGDKTALTGIYMNLAKIYANIKEFELQAHYTTKMMEAFGFGDMFGLDEE